MRFKVTSLQDGLLFTPNRRTNMSRERFYNVSIPEEVEKDGEKKTYWTKVGVMFPGKKENTFNVKLAMFPGLTLFIAPPFKKEDEDF